MRSLICIVLASLVACGGDGSDDLGPAAALFEVPRGAPAPSGFYALPYPNDVRVDEVTGKADMSGYAAPNAIIEDYIEVIGEYQDGFGLSSAAFFRFDNPIDDTSLPSAAESTGDSASVYIVNVDPDSGDYAARTPIRLQFQTFAGEAIGDNWLSVLPYPGFPLNEATTYAVVVTDRVRATDGTPVTPAPDFVAMADPAPPTDTALARAQAIYQPLWDYLDEAGGDERADVVSAAVFTTQDATSIMGKLREVVYRDVPAPEPTDIVWLGEGDNYVWYDGMFDIPEFQAGESPFPMYGDGGDIRFDADGMPIVQRIVPIRFSFTIPKGNMPENGWPVVLYAHGTNGSYHSFRNNGSAERFAAEGLAVFGIDQVLHGPRNPTGGNAQAAFFNFQNPLAGRDNPLQGALDNFQLLRLARDFDYTERHPGGRTIRFDADRIYFFGHSQGGLSGPPFLAYEPEVKGAVLSGAGGLMYMAMLYKTKPVDVTALVAAFVRDFPLDEFNPILALVQAWIDRADPVSYGPLLARAPADGVEPKHIFQTEGFVDNYTPLPSIEGLATSIGGNQVEPVIEPLDGLALRGRDVLTAPVTENQAPVTSVFVQYQAPGNEDGHYVVFDVPEARVQSARFLGTLAETGTATLVSP